MGQRPSVHAHGRRSSSGRWLGRRRCLRRRCRRRFVPRWWNERYCSEPCRKLVRRWQARKRQRAYRARSDEALEKHRADQAQRRKDEKAKGGGRRPSRRGGRGSSRGARGHADPPRGATYCDRPGCYDPPAHRSPHTRCFCSARCRDALRRVEERERKWLVHGAKAGHCWCERELERRRADVARRRDERYRSLLRRHQPRGPPS